MWICLAAWVLEFGKTFDCQSGRRVRQSGGQWR
jgi:hypothetical protein